MRFQALPVMDVVKREEKESKLKTFIQERLATAEATPMVCTVIARSVDSPVIRALAAMAGEHGSASVSARIILSSIECDGSSGLGALENSVIELSLLDDARLLNAHEQLVMGRACWIGDCMRRDPTKRDAYERYASDCAETAAWARLAFQRIRGAARRVSVSDQIEQKLPASVSTLTAALEQLLPPGLPPTSTVSTRH